MARKKTSTTTQKKVKRTQGIPVRFFWLKLIGLTLLITLPFCYGSVFKNVGALIEWVNEEITSYNYKTVKSFGIKIPTRYEVHGIDVSYYQEKIDWSKVKHMKSGDIQIDFAYLKATEGLFTVDRTFKRNWHESKAQNVIRGAYHYFKPRKSGRQQALFFLQTVDLKSGDLPPVIDIEETGRLSPDALRENLKEWLDVVEKRVGEKPVIYTGYKFYIDYLKGYFDDYPLWVAHYYQPQLKIEDAKWNFWQHSDVGKVNGIRTKVDFNVFNGDLEDLKDLCLEFEN
ncbi:glycoside hydrolase family 25 protein [Solitalea koreensis]|uniref:Lysozyme n=1 Tax=Solitalea koreensis TaxID=543615 RepID=A0A521BRK9_9SPHI|nr:glycoside hydrolase family 25 protein [Solitalea koreensis]SMO49812.1 lysozyme [Solitalea koreensis]